MESRSFTLPSTPKLKKSNFSSSLISGATKFSPKINTSRIRISRPALSRTIDFESISPQQSSIENTLVETNNILIQIQKQLSLDFAMRIADEKEKNKALKQGQSRKRLKAEESALEKSTKKIGKGIGKVVDKVISPVKNFFSDLLDFLLTVGAGIAVNAAFEWLSKKENREQLDEWFGWVAKNWKWVAAAIVGVLALQPILNIVGAIGGAIVTIRTALDIFGWARKKLFGGGRPPIPPSNKPGSQSGGQSGNAGGRMSGGSNTGLYYGRNVDPTTGRPMRSPGSVSRYNASMARNLQGKANLGDKARLFFRNNFKNVKLPKINIKGIPRIPALTALFAGLDYASRTGSGQTQTQAISGTAAGATGAILGGLGGKMGGSAIGGTAGAVIGGILGSVVPGAGTLAGAALGAKLGAGAGGFIGMLYGGYKGSELFGKASDKITGVEARAMGGPVLAGKPYLVGELGPELFMSRTDGQIVNSEKTYELISSNVGGGINMIELPPITNQLPPPEIPVPSGPATEVPEVSSVNLADPYRQLTPMLYGITV